MEHIPPPENPGILGVQAEHQPNAKGIQAFQRFRGGGVFVLLQQRIIQHSHQFTGLQGNFHFLFDGLTSGVHQKLQSGIILLQICQHQYFRLAVGKVHIVDLKGLEITDHDPSRRLIKREVSGITAGLLVRRQHLTVRLLISFFQINVRAFLLNQNAGISQITVNKAGVAQFDGHLKFNGLFRVGNAVDIPQQVNPKPLRFLFLVPTIFPVCCKFLCRRPLLNIRHGENLLCFLLCFSIL